MMMGVLQGFEDRLEGAVEGFFSRVFRSGLQPVELARGIRRYAADNQHVTADGVVVPNVYRISLSPKDHERLSTFGESLPRELGQVVAKTSSERGWLLRGPIKVRIEQRDDIKVGRFRIAGRIEVVEREPQPQPNRLTGGSRAAAPQQAAQPSQPPQGDQPGAGSAAAAAGAAGAAPGGHAPNSHTPGTQAPTGHGSGDDRSEIDRTQVISGPPPASHKVRIRTGDNAGAEVPLRGERLSVGRLSSCDLPLPDSTVSREHAALVKRGDAWWVVDLGSTNGTRVNGVQAAEQPVDVGDRIEFGDAVVELVEA